MDPRHGSGPGHAPAGRLFVPVRIRGRGHFIRLFRTPMGGRTAVGFTTRARLATALGGDQPCVELAEPILRALAEPLGVTRLTVDPYAVAAPLPPWTVPAGPWARPGEPVPVSPGPRASGPGSPAESRASSRS